MKSLIYLDQNIVSLLSQGKVILDKKNDVHYVYSKTHFEEIHRSSNPEVFLETLDAIDARLIDLEHDEEYKYTGKAILESQKSALSNYEDYLEAYTEVNFDEHINDPLIAWINGGGKQEALEQLPANIQNQLSNLTEQIDKEAVHLNLEYKFSLIGALPY